MVFDEQPSLSLVSNAYIHSSSQSPSYLIHCDHNDVVLLLLNFLLGQQWGRMYYDFQEVFSQPLLRRDKEATSSHGTVKSVFVLITEPFSVRF